MNQSAQLSTVVIQGRKSQAKPWGTRSVMREANHLLLEGKITMDGLVAECHKTIRHWHDAVGDGSEFRIYDATKRRAL